MALGEGVWSYLALLVRRLFRALCGSKPTVEDGDAETAELLFADDQAKLGDPSQQVVIVMRHGHRIDEADDRWVHQAERPWDPPLSPQGFPQAKSVALELKDLQFDYVISSPFLRCLQTSAQILSQLDLTLDHFIIDCQLGEVFNPRVMNGGSLGLPVGPLKNWMWGEKSIQDAIDEFVDSDPALEEKTGKPVILDIPFPSEIETIGEAHRRYSSALNKLGDAYAGFNLLIVTHGECIRMAVNSVIPEAVVYESRHTGYVSKVRSRSKKTLTRRNRKSYAYQSFKWTEWRITTESGKTGVSWML